MKKYSVLLVVLILAAQVNAQTTKTDAKKTFEPAKTTTLPGPNPNGETIKKEEKPANPNAPKIVFTEETYNFGEVPEGPQVTHTFKFTNAGKEPLILTNVQASCGCTTPSWPKEPILPGKESSIVVTYNTQGRPGAFTKSITVHSNSDTESKVIYIKGEVEKEDPTKSVPMEQPNMLAPKN